MAKTIFNNIFILICLILIQIMICNHIMIFNVAMAFVFIYVIVRLPMNLDTGWVLTWAFLIGLIIDIFSDTLGVNALSCTLLAILRKPVLYAYIPRDDRTKDIEPSLASLGFGIYAKYLLSMCCIYCLLLFVIEYFNYAAIKEVIIMSASSALFTFVLLLGIDSLIIGNHRHNK